MGFRELEYFLAVVREGSILRASEALFLTQPNLSRTMHRLEEEFGQELLIRGTRHITLTRAGELFKSRVEELLALRKKLYEEMSQHLEFESNDKVEGHVVICGEEGGIMTLLGDVVRDMQDKNPNIQYNFSCSDDVEIADKLAKGLLHFGLITEPFDTSRCEELTLAENVAWGLTVRSDSEYATKESITPDDLRNIPIICPTKSNMRDTLEKWSSIPFDELNTVATYDSVYSCVTLVESGVGGAVCLQNCAEGLSDGTLRFVPFSPALTSDVKLVWQRFKVLPESCMAFLQQLKAALPKQSQGEISDADSANA